MLFLARFYSAAFQYARVNDYLNRAHFQTVFIAKGELDNGSIDIDRLPTKQSVNLDVSQPLAPRQNDMTMLPASSISSGGFYGLRRIG